MTVFALSKHIPRRQKRVGTFLAFSVMVTDSSSGFSGHSLSTRFTYTPPEWAIKSFDNAPENGRLRLANLPTPLYRITRDSQRDVENRPSILKKLEEMNINLYVKRDDMSGGVETGGNKIRKLEFLLADAKANQYDSVVTIGGEQSNHCRATAAAARMLGMTPHIILRTRRADAIQSKTDDMGFTGNVLFDRVVGASIYTCTPGEYGRIGSQELVKRLCSHLEKNSNGKPYAIPVGGSNGIGTWGYINGVDELISQWNSIESTPSLDHVIFACGSGGTAAGIGLGLACAFKDNPTVPAPQVSAIGVCDSPDYFYGHISQIAEEMGLNVEEATIDSFVRNSMHVHQGKGLGYAASTPQELEFISNFAIETGIVLDPVYSGKALYHFLAEVLETDEGNKYRGKNLLFWHTGGALGLFDKTSDLDLRGSSVNRLDIYGKGLECAIDISEPL